MRFTHILTSIPKGSRVIVRTLARIVQFDEIVESGAIGILANREAYPLRITLKPTCVGVAKHAGGITVVVPMDSEVPLVEGFIARGGDYELTITSFKEFNPGGLEAYLPFDGRVGPWSNVQQVRAEPNPVTDVRRIYKCAGCSVEVKGPGNKYCTNCTPQVLCCEHPKIGAINPEVCGNPLAPKYGACREHLILMGFKMATGRPPRVRTVPQLPRGKPKGRAPAPPKEAPVALPGQRRKYKHTAAYYEKRGLPVPVLEVV